MLNERDLVEVDVRVCVDAMKAGVAKMLFTKIEEMDILAEEAYERLKINGGIEQIIRNQIEEVMRAEITNYFKYGEGNHKIINLITERLSDCSGTKVGK